MKRIILCLVVIGSLVQFVEASEKDKQQEKKLTPLEEFLDRARKAPPLIPVATGSLFSPTNTNLYLFRDVKARDVNDIVTIQIIEAASASNTANTATQKAGDANVSAANLFGLESAGGTVNFAKLLQASSALNFSGTGTTARSGQLQAWLSARIVEVLPNGDMVIEGTKDVTINNERQSLCIRGVIRQRDVTPGNVVLSTAIAHMDIQFDGKGVVTNANKPGWLYWLFTKILPF